MGCVADTAAPATTAFICFCLSSACDVVSDAAICAVMLLVGCCGCVAVLAWSAGVEQDWVRASAIYYEAYKERSAEAMFNLGFMHEFGAGVPQVGLPCG